MSDYTWADVDRDAYDASWGFIHPEDYVREQMITHGRKREDVLDEVVEQILGTREGIEEIRREIDHLKDDQQTLHEELSYWKTAYEVATGEEF